MEEIDVLKINDDGDDDDDYPADHAPTPEPKED